MVAKSRAQASQSSPTMIKINVTRESQTKKLTKNCNYCTRPIGHCSGDFSTIQTVKLKHHEL